jgi:transposase-like protein
MKETDLIDGLFIPDEKQIMKIFRQIRWADGVYCPQCKSFKVQKRGKEGKTRRYSCNTCGLNFSDLTGTIFAYKRLPLGEIFYILAHLDKKSVKRLAEELGHSRSTVHLLAKKFRENLAVSAPDPILTGEIEIDEMYIRAGDKGLKKTNQDKKG